MSCSTTMSVMEGALSGQGQQFPDVRGEPDCHEDCCQAQTKHAPKADNGKVGRDLRGLGVSCSKRVWNVGPVSHDSSHGILLDVQSLACRQAGPRFQLATLPIRILRSDQLAGNMIVLMKTIRDRYSAQSQSGSASSVRRSDRTRDQRADTPRAPATSRN